MSRFETDGYCVFDVDPEVTAWANAAAEIAKRVVQDEELRAQWLRHKDTWFVGVDALPNAADGSIQDVPLRGPWKTLIQTPSVWHKAQLSVVYEGYPKRDSMESDANHRFRIKRAAAHVDGILLEEGRRYLREPHAFVLGIPLGNSTASPLVVWPESHRIIGEAFRALIGSQDPSNVDLTEGYKAVRAKVFEQIEPVEIHATLGQSVLAHRHLLHGVAPWKTTDLAPEEGRMIAYFRPQFTNSSDWISSP